MGTLVVFVEVIRLGKTSWSSIMLHLGYQTRGPGIDLLATSIASTLPQEALTMSQCWSILTERASWERMLLQEQCRCTTFRPGRELNSRIRMNAQRHQLKNGPLRLNNFLVTYRAKQMKQRNSKTVHVKHEIAHHSKSTETIEDKRSSTMIRDQYINMLALMYQEGVGRMESIPDVA